MKQRILFFSTLSILAICRFQVAAQTAQRNLDINNVSATITNANGIFNDGTNGRFIVPKVQPGQLGKSTIYAAAPWIGGLSNGQLHLMAETYKQNGRDIKQGPVSATYPAAALNYWDKLWKVNKSDIIAFVQKVKNGENVQIGQFDDILSWPARGNTWDKDTTREYAPFVDVDNDHIYNPLVGDYPLIKGDQCVYTIMNDDVLHTETGGLPLKIEIHRMVYAYQTTNEVNNTVFVDYKVVNKSTSTYEDFIFSPWVDFDLGNYADDYVGTDTVRNMIYGYNGDPSDEGSTGYGMNPPAQACVLISHPMRSSMYYNNTFSPVTGNPSIPDDYYNYMKGLWRNGVGKTASDSGYAGPGDPTKFSFAGDPCNDNGWWEGGAGIAPGDRRMLASLPPQTLNPEQALDVTLAFVYARASSGGNIASVCALKSAVDSVTAWYKNGGPTTGIFETKRELLSFSVSPNPAKQSITIEGVELKNATVVIYDITGKQLKMQAMEQTQNISVSDLHSGIYFVQVTTDNGTSTKRLIVE